MAILNTVAQFGRYVLRSKLAQTSASEVWLAEIDGAAVGSSPVVFKKLRAELTENPTIAQAFKLRARRASHLRHDAIARVLDVVVDHNDCGLAMEYIDGKTLRQLISAVGGAGNALPVWFAIHVARRVCQALEHSHSGVDSSEELVRITHDNLCPENVFLTFLGQVKVADFGLSYTAIMDAASGAPDESMRVRAKSLGRDPKTGRVDEVQTDLDGVGRILYELLTGICPAPSNASGGDFLPPSHYAPWVNVEVDQLLSRILSPADAKRFCSATEIRAALDEYLSARRHDVTATHIAGLVSVLFSAECRDSAPPTMRLHAGAVELAMLRSRRTTPPDLEGQEALRHAPAIKSTVPPAPNIQLTRPTIPSPITEGVVTPTSEVRGGPFRHDWDLALKRAREEAQATQRLSDTMPIATIAVRPAPPIDPLEMAVREFELGLEHMRKGEFESALKAWERALEFDPQHRVCRANLSLLKKRLGSPT